MAQLGVTTQTVAFSFHRFGVLYFFVLFLFLNTNCGNVSNLT